MNNLKKTYNLMKYRWKNKRIIHKLYDDGKNGHGAPCPYDIAFEIGKLGMET